MTFYFIPENDIYFINLVPLSPVLVKMMIKCVFFNYLLFWKFYRSLVVFLLLFWCYTRAKYVNMLIYLIWLFQYLIGSYTFIIFVALAMNLFSHLLISLQRFFHSLTFPTKVSYVNFSSWCYLLYTLKLIFHC